MIDARLIMHICKASIFLLIYCLLQTNVHCLRRSARSVETCHLASPNFPFSDREDCARNCGRFYLHLPHIRRIQKNKKYLAEPNYRVEQISDRNKDYNQMLGKGGTATVNLPVCCCRFESPWEDFVKPELIGRELKKDDGKRKKCTLLLSELSLRKTTRESYNTACKYVQQKEPLTALELLEFAEAAKYLNREHPRHPTIWYFLHREKQVKKITNEAYNELEKALHEYLLDDYVTYEQRGGYKLNTDRLGRFMKLKNVLHNAMKCKIVAKAIDELVISNMIVDLAAAVKHLSEFNHELRIPEHLTGGGYDAYDKDLAIYFEMPSSVHLDCKSLSSKIAQVRRYLDFMKSLSNYLPEKGSYEYMESRYKNLIDIKRFKEVYEKLVEVNCKPKKTVQRRSRLISPKAN